MKRLTLIIYLAFLTSFAFAIGDVLTVIQRPILSVPQIATPGEVFNIECNAPPQTQNWEVELRFDDIVLPLSINSASYSSGYERWFIEVTTPVPEIFELYDLYVNADGVEEDTSRNSVYIIPEFKDNYKFVQITDTHLPTYMYYYENGSESDSTNTMDLRALIEDVNIIDPEFVLLTGDLIHEGELEEFDSREYFTKAKRVLGELEVPVYLVSGNHDIGGWDSTPPPLGTARYNWWRFFGWERLANPPQSEFYYTQNYSFKYGDNLFVGLESYINYEDYFWLRYGDTSFTDRQIQWLQNELSVHDDTINQILFYHYDFDEELNLSNLGVEMALYGHIHHNEGSIYSQPYNLGTDNAGSNTRAMRFISMNNDTLQPHHTVYAGYDGNAFNVSYSANQEHDEVTATILNNYSLTFDDIKLKFEMPSGEFGYSCQNGTIQQIIRRETSNICYVRADIGANENMQITLTTDYNSGIDEEVISAPVYTLYPNPVKNELRIQLEKPDDALAILLYNIKGQLKRKVSTNRSSDYMIDTKDLPNGVFFLKVEGSNSSATRKVVIMK